MARVHPEFLQKQELPPALIRKRIWKERYDDINAFERIRVELEKEQIKISRLTSTR